MTGSNAGSSDNNHGEGSNGGGARPSAGESSGSARPGVSVVSYVDIAGPSMQPHALDRRRILYLGVNRRRSRNVEDVGEELRDFERRNRANEARDGANGGARTGDGSRVEQPEDNGPNFPEIANYNAEVEQDDYDALMNYLARVDEEDFFDADEEGEDHDWVPGNENGGEGDADEQEDLPANEDEDVERDDGDDSGGEEEDEADQSGSDNGADHQNSDAESNHSDHDL